MILKDYLTKFTLKPDMTFPDFSEEETISLFQEIKTLFFKEKSHKWSSIKFSYEYVSSKGIDPEIFVRFLEHIIDSYYTVTNRKKGKISALGFIKDLKKSQAFERAVSESKWILPPNADIIAFLEAAKEYASFFIPGSHEKMVKHLHEEVNTGLSWYTLRRYYYDQQK